MSQSKQHYLVTFVRTDGTMERTVKYEATESDAVAYAAAGFGYDRQPELLLEILVEKWVNPLDKWFPNKHNST